MPNILVRRFLPFDPQILKKSFEEIRPRMSEYSPLFYENFWRDYPETRELFGRNMTKVELDTRINHFMLFIVENCESPKVWLAYVEALAVRHKAYGIFEHQFHFVCETNLKTLKQLKGSLSAAEEAAWRAGFGFLEKLMKSAAKFKTKVKN